MTRKSLACWILCLLIAAAPAAAAQGDPRFKSPPLLEEMLGRKSALLWKEYYQIGSCLGRYGDQLSLEAVVVAESGRETDRLRGLRIKVHNKDDKSYAIALVDLVEIESLSGALGHMLETAAKWKNAQREYSEMSYMTAGDFEIGFYQIGLEQTVFASCGSIESKTIFFNSPDDLGALRKLIDNAHKLLMTK